MEIRRCLRRLAFVVAVTIAPLLGAVGWRFSPGTEAYLGALAYWPVILLGTILAAVISVALYLRRTLPAGIILIPGTLIGA